MISNKSLFQQYSSFNPVKNQQDNLYIALQEKLKDKDLMIRSMNEVLEEIDQENINLKKEMLNMQNYQISTIKETEKLMIEAETISGIISNFNVELNCCLSKHTQQKFKVNCQQLQPSFKLLKQQEFQHQGLNTLNVLIGNIVSILYDTSTVSQSVQQNTIQDFKNECMELLNQLQSEYENKIVEVDVQLQQKNQYIQSLELELSQFRLAKSHSNRNQMFSDIYNIQKSFQPDFSQVIINSQTKKEEPLPFSIGEQFSMQQNQTLLEEDLVRDILENK